MTKKFDLKQRRIELGLTMKEVAKAVGVSESTVSRWETGNIRNMKKNRLVSLANILQIPLKELILDEISEPAEKDEREIEKDLQDMLHSVSTASFNSVSEIEDIEAFKAAVKVAMIQAKRIAKKKYTPKKEDD